MISCRALVDYASLPQGKGCIYCFSRGAGSLHIRCYETIPNTFSRARCNMQPCMCRYMQAKHGAKTVVTLSCPGFAPATLAFDTNVRSRGLRQDLALPLALPPRHGVLTQAKLVFSAWTARARPLPCTPARSLPYTRPLPPFP